MTVFQETTYDVLFIGRLWYPVSAVKHITISAEKLNIREKLPYDNAADPELMAVYEWINTHEGDFCRIDATEIRKVERTTDFLSVEISEGCHAETQIIHTIFTYLDKFTDEQEEEYSRILNAETWADADA